MSTEAKEATAEYMTAAWLPSVGEQLQQFARALTLSPDELVQRSLRAFVESEIRLAEQDIADIRERYHVLAPQELHEKIESRDIYSHPAWEDLIEWETLLDHISRLRALQEELEGQEKLNEWGV